MSDIQIGLQLSLIGLAVTFLALGLLIALMVMLLRLFPVRKEKTADPAPEKVVSAESELEEMAVALAVGISLLERMSALEMRDPSLGRLLEK